MNAQEAAAATLAFQAALTRIGIEVVVSLTNLWNSGNRQSDQMIEDAADDIADARSYLYDLAVAYYRLHRALLTGFTVPLPGDAGRDDVQLDELRVNFLAELPVDLADEYQYRPGPDDAVIPVDDEDVFNAREARARELQAMSSALSEMESKGVANFEKKLQEVAKAVEDAGRNDTPLTSVEVDGMRELAAQDAGARMSAAGERIAKDAARGAVWDASQRDPRVIGYVRISGTGSPCGFCAMLISRGPSQFYNTEGTAGKLSADSPSVRDGKANEGDKYHDNCQCIVEAIYSMEQFNESPLYKMNRQYAEEWPDVTAGSRDQKEMLTEWRAFFRWAEQAGEFGSIDRKLAAWHKHRDVQKRRT